MLVSSVSNAPSDRLPALGQRQFGDVRVTSALPPKTDVHREGAARPKSANKRYRNALFNHLIGTAQQRLGNCKAQRLGRLEIDDHLDFRGPLDWQVGGFLAPENLTRVDAD
jgi:hypothetical protein